MYMLAVTRSFSGPALRTKWSITFQQIANKDDQLNGLSMSFVGVHVITPYVLSL